MFLNPMGDHLYLVDWVIFILDDQAPIKKELP